MIFCAGSTRSTCTASGIPDFAALNEKLLGLTGWTVVAVPGLVPDEVFFEHLANRRFPAANFIRRADELDYLEEPDVFHDVFGHVPMLTDPVFADYMQAYGKGGLRALSLGHLAHLARLYWYTVEFGLLQTPQGLRIYGAGIVSSRTESIFALESDSPHRLGFDLERVMRTPYRIDDFQQVYFVIPSLRYLLDATTSTDFAPIYDEACTPAGYSDRRDRTGRQGIHKGHPGLCPARRAAGAWRGLAQTGTGEEQHHAGQGRDRHRRLPACLGAPWGKPRSRPGAFGRPGRGEPAG